MKLIDTEYYDAITLAKYFKLTDTEIRRRAKIGKIKSLKKLFELKGKVGSTRQSYKLVYMLGEMKELMKWKYGWGRDI